MLILLYLYPMGGTVAIDSEPTIDLATTPTSRLFTIENLKPGDWATKTINIENKGNMDFYYKMTSNYESGSKIELDFETLEPEDFYRQLLLKVEDSEGLLYDGKLSDFGGLEQRFLSSFTNEDLNLSVVFPWESGNEFQGIATTVIFTFTAEGQKPSPPGGGGGGGGNDGDNGNDGNAPKDTPSKQKDAILSEPAIEGKSDERSIDDKLSDAYLEEEASAEEIQAGLPSILPKTGEINPLYFLIAGLMITLLGLFLIILILKAQKAEVNRIRRKG